MLQAVSIVVLSLMLQENSSPQPKVTEKLEITCKIVAEVAVAATVETADEKAARHAADFEKALMQMDKCLNKVLVGAASAGGGSGGNAGASGAGAGAQGATASEGTLQGTEQQAVSQQQQESEQQASQASGNNGAPSQSGMQPNRETLPAPSQNTVNDTPADIPSKATDDVVAQQLRELAEQEPDPELKKKYWNQYRRYKGLKEIDE